MKADLHVHSTASDGTWDPQQLVEEAKKSRLEVLALTDHDTVANVAETEKLAKAAGIKFIPAAEICATKDGHQYHILGYGIDVTNKELLKLLAHNEYLLDKKDIDSIQILVDKGWPITMEEFNDYEYNRHRGGWKALAYLQDKSLCGDVNDFFSRIFTAENALGFPNFPPVDIVAKVIHDAGGVAICAHVASDFHGTVLEDCLENLRDEPIDGFECFHSEHDERETKILLDYCKKHNLMISGGSDCHGTFVATRKLGKPCVDTKDLFLPNIL